MIMYANVTNIFDIYLIFYTEYSYNHVFICFCSCVGGLG